MFFLNLNIEFSRMRERLHILRTQYTNAALYFNRLSPVFARCRMRHIFFSRFLRFRWNILRVYVWVCIARFTRIAILWFSRIFLRTCLSTFYYFANCWRAKWVSYLELPKTLRFFILYFVQIGNACTSRWRCWFFK